MIETIILRLSFCLLTVEISIIFLLLKELNYTHNNVTLDQLKKFVIVSGFEINFLTRT